MLDRMEFKFASEGVDSKTGEFAGYGAVFGNVDSHGDVIVPGAFSETLDQWKARESLPVMKLMHGTGINPFSGSDLPIGKYSEMREDSRGLYVKGKLSGLDTDRRRYHYALMQDGALNALSIGYKAVRHSRGTMPQVKRQLEAVRLFEVSLLPEGSNDQARVTDMKSWDGAAPSVREFEEFLRDAGGFSKSLAAAIAAKATPHLRGEPEAKANDELLEFLTALRG